MNASIFAQNWNSFIAPKLIKGHYPRTKNEVVIDQSMKNYNIGIGDHIQLNGSTDEYKVVGLTNNSKFLPYPSFILIYPPIGNYNILKQPQKPSQPLFKKIMLIFLGKD